MTVDDGDEGLLIRLGMPPDRVSVAHHSGPGLRIIFWVQGCSLLCTRHCLNPHLLSRRGGYLTQPGALADRLLYVARDYRDVEGVTVLGGEPFDQSGALACALRPVRRAGLSVMVYTGHLLEDLQRTPGAGPADLLAVCDLLVDGPFLDALHDPLLVWRGSSNQRILRLTKRYSAGDIARAIAFQGRAAFLSHSPGSDAIASGAQTPSAARDLRQLAQELAASSSSVPGGVR